jgi:hypothetical protein
MFPKSSDVLVKFAVVPHISTVIKKQKPRESLGAFEILNDACQINRNSPPNHVKHQNESSSDN